MIIRLRIDEEESREVSESLENLEGMDEGQLRELIQRAQTTLRERATSRIEELRKLAREAGFDVTLTKIGESEGKRGRRRFGERREEKGTDRRRRKVQPKYRNPENEGETWSGRGRKPRWVEMALAHDRTLDDLAIPG
jgi:DNA-binding protein H-NS